jgi:hypothetical protein
MYANSVAADVIQYPVRLQSPNFLISVGSSLYTVWETLAFEDIHRLPVVGMSAKQLLFFFVVLQLCNNLLR